MSEDGDEPPALAWARSRATVAWLQLRLRDPLVEVDDASSVLPAEGLLDAHVVALVDSARHLSAHFTVDHTSSRYALHVWIYHLLGGPGSGLPAPSTDRRSKATEWFGPRCEAMHNMHGQATSLKWKALAKAKREHSGVSAARDAYRAVIRSPSVDAIRKLQADAAERARAPGGKRQAEPAAGVAPKRVAHASAAQPPPLASRPPEEMEVEDRGAPPLQQQAATPPTPVPPAASIGRQPAADSRRSSGRAWGRRDASTSCVGRWRSRKVGAVKVVCM